MGERGQAATHPDEPAGTVRGCSREAAAIAELERRLRRRTSLDEALAAIAADLTASAVSDLDSAADRALAAFGRFLDADHACLFSLSDDLESVERVYEWCADDIPPRIDALRLIPASRLRGWIERLERLAIVRVEDSRGPGAGESAEDATGLTAGARSLIAVPLMLRGRFLGFLAFDSRTPRSWPDEDLAALRMAAVLLASGVLRRRAERDRRLLAQAVRSVGECVTITGLDHTILFANQAFLTTYGYEESELLSQPIDLVRGPDCPGPALVEIAEATLAGGWRGELVNRRKDGSEFPIALSTSVVRDEQGLPIAYIGVTSDLTERRRASEQAALLRVLVDQTIDGIEVIDPLTGRFLDVNERACLVHGYTRGEYLNLSVAEIDPMVAALGWEGAGAKLMREGRGTFETTHRRKDGTGFPVEVSVGFSGPDRQYLIAVVRDITDRKRAEQALRDSEARFRGFVEHAVVGVYRTTPEGRVMMANPAAARMMGFESVDALLAADLEEVAREKGYRRSAFRETLERDGVVRGFETSWTQPDGEVVCRRESARVVRGDDGEVAYYEGFIEDTSKEKVLALQLQQAQKIEAVGRLAGGVAHDFNNLLQSLLSQIYLLRSVARDPEKVESVAAELDRNARRGAALARQLLLFSRRETVKPEHADLGSVVVAATQLLRSLVREDIAFVVNPSSEPLSVAADRGQLEQVLMNLVVNAADAMPDGGTLTVRTGRDGADSVWLSVSDTGVGIPDAIRDRIFEPFFTTKEGARGTGLGLSVVHGIVSQHGGRIEVHSAPGRGSTFKVVLPQEVSGEHRPVPSLHRDAQPLPRGRGERIVVVEDEAGARVGLTEILSSLGYEVVAAGSGEEAGEIPCEPPADVLLTDLVLPGISGADLARGLVDRWPGLRVILMSGYTDDEVVRRGVAAGRMRFLQKPFDIAALACEVRDALQS